MKTTSPVVFLNDEIAGNNYDLSVSTYVESKDIREAIGLVKLNAKIQEIGHRNRNCGMKLSRSSRKVSGHSRKGAWGTGAIDEISARLRGIPVPAGSILHQTSFFRIHSEIPLFSSISIQAWLAGESNGGGDRQRYTSGGFPKNRQ